MLKRRIGVILLSILMLTGCGNVKLTTGLSSRQFARIAGYEVDMGVARLLLSEYKYSYENMFNGEVWDKEVDGMTTEEFVKNSVKDTIESIVYARNMSVELKIEITEDERERIKKASDQYMYSFDNESKSFDKKAVEQFYTDLLLAEKCFYAVTDSVDTMVSTDEARKIQVQYIFLEETAKEQGEMILKELESGEDFGTLAMEYSKDKNYSMELSRGEHCKEFCDAAFALEMGQTSKLVESPYGYFIIKCINYNMDCDYDEQCEKIILARRKSVFTEAYLDYADGKSVEFNDDFWEDTPMEELSKGSGNLYSIYEEFVQTK